MDVQVEVQRLCYFISEEHKDEQGYTPLLVRENTPGFRVMDWHWGLTKQAAQQKADEMNRKMGLDAGDVASIIATTVE